MKKLLSALLFGLLLTACNSSTSDKERELLEKENQLLTKENELLKKEKLQQEDATKILNNDKVNKSKQTPSNGHINWLGVWTFTDNAPVDYTLKIEDKIKGMNICTFNATGIQTFYDIDCRGVDNGNSFELYYWSTNEGVFYEDRINRDKPILTLKQINGKTLTYWNQLINNYVDKGNHSGQVCFEK